MLGIASAKGQCACEQSEGASDKKNMDEVIKEFLVESAENLDRLDSALVELEANPADKPSLDSIFRTIHTIKGSCGFIGFNNLQRLTHVAENLLSRLREGKLNLNSEITSALLAVVDVVRQVMARIEQTEQEGENTHTELIERLTRLCNGESTAAPAPGHIPAPADLSQSSTFSNPATAVQTVLSSPPPLPPPSSIPLAPSLEPAAHAAAEPSEARSQGISERNIPVDVGLLNKLMNLVGELVLARNQIVQHSTASQNVKMFAASQRRSVAAFESDHNRAAGKRDEDAHAAHWQCLG